MADKSVSFDLDGMTVEELTALGAAVEAKRLEKLEEAKAALMEEFRTKAAALGVSLGSLLAGRKRASPSKEKGKVAVKYRGPKGEEWTGRGKMPRWMADILQQGRKREEFAVKGGE